MSVYLYQYIHISILIYKYLEGNFSRESANFLSKTVLSFLFYGMKIKKKNLKGKVYSFQNFSL